MFDQLMKGMSPEGEEKTKEEKPKKSEFEGFTECLLFSETTKITVDEEGVLISAVLDQLPIPYDEIISFVFTNYRLEIVTVHGTITISRMGQSGQWLYDHLYAAYNAAVLKALLVEGSHEAEVRGVFEAEENGEIIRGEAFFRLYKDCVCILPADDHGRRLPLCFVSGMEKDRLRVTLSLATGERYMFSMMGSETDFFIEKLAAALRSLRERSMKQLRDMDDSLGSMQASIAAKLMPEGVHAAVEKLSLAVPTLMTTFEHLIQESRISDSYQVLKSLCGNDRLFLGIKSSTKEEKTQSMLTELSAGEKVVGQLIWLIGVSRSGTRAAVELALPGNEAAATYLYDVQGEPERFAMMLNRGMEATKFQRELFTLSNEELVKSGHRTEAMLIHRTPSLQLMRKCFVGRVIHSSQDKWKKEMEKYFSSVREDETQEREGKGEQQTRFCTN
ncbi:hypothetical protein [Methanorbis rubei]|uniref:Uncharacterized protein n=1 Tax=Methanorbis rubei TaxID=3028300 RepID=A0AAE4MEW1_9EURY|nr:hypothetical protein [Methanocorpusculaceae archaeon Cs1]